LKVQEDNKSVHVVEFLQRVIGQKNIHELEDQGFDSDGVAG